MWEDVDSSLEVCPLLSCYEVSKQLCMHGMLAIIIIIIQVDSRHSVYVYCVDLIYPWLI